MELGHQRAAHPLPNRSRSSAGERPRSFPKTSWARSSPVPRRAFPLRVKAGFDPDGRRSPSGAYCPPSQAEAVPGPRARGPLPDRRITGIVLRPDGPLRKRERPSREEVLRNAETYRDQVFKGSIRSGRASGVRNSEWLSKLTPRRTSSGWRPDDRRPDAGAGRLQQRGTGRAADQASTSSCTRSCRGDDSVVLKADVEIGGTDQFSTSARGPGPSAGVPASRPRLS